VEPIVLKLETNCELRDLENCCRGSQTGVRRGEEVQEVIKFGEGTRGIDGCIGWMMRKKYFFVAGEEGKFFFLFFFFFFFSFFFFCGC
jgi:hypothetical protein